MCPAAGQGALGIEIRNGDSGVTRHLAFLDDQAPRIATTCERALLNKLGGGCQVPIGAFANRRRKAASRSGGRASRWYQGVARIGRRRRSGAVGRERGWRVAESRGRCDSAGSVWRNSGGTRATLDCVAAGDSPACCDYFPSMRSSGKPPKWAGGRLQGMRVLVGRARHQASALSAGLRELGAEVLEIPLIEIRKPRFLRRWMRHSRILLTMTG